MVTFRHRPFDLAAYRAAVSGRRPEAAVAEVVRGLAAMVRVHQAPFVEFIESVGGTVTDQWWLVNGCVIEVPFAKLGTVRQHAMVLRLHPDRAVWATRTERVSRAAGSRARGPIKTATDARNHAADAVQAGGIRGQGVAVAIIDSGVDSDMAGMGRPHRTFYVGGDISNRTGGGLSGSRLLDNVRLGRLAADDPINHGTAVAAVVAGEVWSGGWAADPGHAPASKIVSYSVLHNLLGGSTLSTIATAFQRVAADRAKHGIVAVNNSFTGSSDPTDPSQQAMDSAARNADLVVVVSAGNSGNRALNSPSVANGLAVGAVRANTRVLARFSAIGPLLTDAQRTYPDLVANGVDVAMPKIDTEQADQLWVASGTSFAAPQVCGAAALYRSVRRSATALETKAAILATTENIGSQNPTVAGRERNHYGLGYLRDDLLIALAQGGGTIRNDQLTATKPVAVHSSAVVGGAHYAVVVAWHRQNLASNEWSDLDLMVEIGGELLGAGSSPRNLYEKVVFRAPSTGSVVVTVRASRLEAASVPFSMVCVAVSPQPSSGGVVRFGVGCPGTGRVNGVSVVAPQDRRRQFGDLAMDVLMYRDRREQFIYDRSRLPATFIARSMALRIDPVLVPKPIPYWTDLEIRMGHSANSPANISSRFAANVVGSMTMVFGRKRLQLPTVLGRNQQPTEWAVEIPFDRRFTFDGNRGGGRHLLVDILHFDASATGGILIYPTNGMWQKTGVPRVSWLRGSRRTSTTGGRLTGRGPVLGFAIDTPGGTAPILTAVAPPQPWAFYTVDLRRARPRSPVTLITGASNRAWSGLPLPFDLGLLGAPSCSLLVSGDFLQSASTGVDGAVQFRLPVPRLPGISQVRLFQQALVFDGPANRLGVVTTNGLRVTVGGR